MYLVHLLLPVHDNRKKDFSSEKFAAVRDELTERFGGVTAFLRSPAEGLWKDDNEVSRDDVVMFEVTCEELDESWWSEYRKKLEVEFSQEEIMVWAAEVTRL